MSKSLKWVLIIGGTAAVLFAGIIVVAIYNVYTMFDSAFSPEVPDRLKNARVMVGADFLERREFFALTAKGGIEIVSEGVKEKGEKERQRVISSRIAESLYGFEDLKVINGNLIAAAQYGGLAFGPDGKLKSRVLFEPFEEAVKIGPFTSKNYRLALNDLKIVPLTSETYGFLSGSSVDGMTVYDSSGNVLWNYGRKKVDLSELTISDEERNRRYDESVILLETAVGDLDNDGKSEYIAAMKAEGIKVFSQDGKELWSVAEEYPGLPLMVEDIDDDGTKELVQIGGKVFDGEGKAKGEFLGYDSGVIVFARSEDQKTSIQSCNIYSGKTVCSDETRTKVVEGEAPMSEVELDGPKPTPIEVDGEYIPRDNSVSLAHPSAAWVRLKAGEPKYLAIVAEFIGIPRANLYVYDSNGKLVFHELIPEGAKTIAVLPSEGETDAFFVGGSTSIWKYTAK